MVSVIFLIFIGLIYYLLWRKSPSFYVNELFGGFKNNLMSQLYFFFFVLRRLLIAAIVLVVTSEQVVNKLFLFYAVHILSLCYIVIVRPFDNTLDNLIDLINEVFFIVISSFLIPMQIEDFPGEDITIVMIYLVLANGVIISIILYSHMIYALCIYLKNK